MTSLIIYHAHCMDGMAAAWVTQTHLKTSSTLLPAQYNDTPPDLTPFEHVYIVDFSYKKDVMRALFLQNPNITLLDHHKTALEDLHEFKQDTRCTFDMGKCGAILAWEHFNSTTPPPLLLYIQDRDLWQWKLPHSKAVSLALRIHIKEPQDFTPLMAQEDPITALIAQGTSLLDYQDLQVQRMTHKAQHITLTFEGLTHHVPICAAPCLHSEVGEALCIKHSSPFSITFSHQADGGVTLSFRGLKGHNTFDLAAMTQRSGGGGHANAAGTKVKLPLWYAILYTKYWNLDRI